MSTVNPDSVRAIAKKDFQDAVRSWLFWGLSAFFFSLIALVAVVLGYLAEDIGMRATTVGLIQAVSLVTRVVIPIIGLIVGWKAIAGERESGSIKVLLSLPHSRRDVVVGKLLGRSAVLSISLVIGFSLAAAVVLAMIGAFDVVDYLGLLLISIVYGVAYTSIAVGISALTRSTTVAGAAIFGVFVLFYVVWNVAFSIVQVLVGAGYLPATEFAVEGQTFERPHDAFYFINNFDPGIAYSNALEFLTSASDLDDSVVDMNEVLFEGAVPFFMQDWFGFLILLFWIAVPLAVALYRFDRVDI